MPSTRFLLAPFRGTVRSLLIAFLVLGSLTTLWSFASPLMAVPDEPAHAIKAAAVARGQFQAQTSGKQGDPVVVQVPKYVADLPLQSCTAFKVDVTADCAPPIDASDRATVPAPTTAGNYNPLFYLVVGLPSRLLAGAPALYAMRIVSGLFSACFLALAFMAARRMRHSLWPLAACVVALTPMTLYLSGSINPNSLEIACTAAFFMSLCVVLENPSSLRSEIMALAAMGASGFVLANTRALSLLWLGLALVSALIIYGWPALFAMLRDKMAIAMTAFTALGCMAALGWLVMAETFKSLIGTPSTITPDQAFFTMLDRTFDYVTGYIGLIGWVDTLAPFGVQIFWHFCFGAVMLAGLTADSIRRRWALAPLLAAIVVLPPILQAQVVQELGYIWQGRYLLALVVLLLLACGVALSDRESAVSRRTLRIAFLLMVTAVLAHAYTFIYALRRYTVGLDPAHTNWSEMGLAAWQPPMTWQFLAAAYLLVLILGAVFGYRFIFHPRHDTPRVVPQGPPARVGSDRRNDNAVPHTGDTPA